MSSPAAPEPTGGDGGDGGGGSEDFTELVIAIVALIISLLAFIIAILQALQQYFASATGFSSCGVNAIGKWAKFSQRRMLWSEFRFEVQFEHPVIFVAWPENTKGPLGDETLVTDPAKKIVRLDGGKKTYDYTSDTGNFNDNEVKESTQQNVHTADNETATWYALLTAICQMERESRDWQESRLREWRRTTDAAPPRNIQSPPPPIPTPIPRHLLVCMQRKRRSWDSMPSDVERPYATTTISHIVEIAAMLGIYWRQFDLNNDQYRAQGNGFVLYGSYKHSLGITFTFQKQGQATFKQDRLVNNLDVKKLCFGMAPTIFRHREVHSAYADDPKGLGTLQLGSMEGIAQALAAFGCDMDTVNHFRKNPDQARHSHVFPIPFEMLGMVCDIFHIKGSVFRMIPNPVAFYWDPTTFSMPVLLMKHIRLLKLLVQEKPTFNSEHIGQIIAWGNRHHPRPMPVRVLTMPLARPTDINGTSLINDINHLREGIQMCDDYFQRTSLSIVRKVVRVHLQQVLGILNKNNTIAAAATTTEGRDGEKDNQAITIDDIDSASTDEKESLLAEMYFDQVRQAVIQAVDEQALLSRRRQTQRARAGAGRTEAAAAAAGAGPEPEEAAVSPHRVNEVWCTLMFRMLCWLQLHDFHRMDIQLNKSDAYENRMPAYII